MANRQAALPCSCPPRGPPFGWPTLLNFGRRDGYGDGPDGQHRVTDWEIRQAAKGNRKHFDDKTDAMREQNRAASAESEAQLNKLDAAVAGLEVAIKAGEVADKALMVTGIWALGKALVQKGVVAVVGALAGRWLKDRAIDEAIERLPEEYQEGARIAADMTSSGLPSRASAQVGANIGRHNSRTDVGASSNGLPINQQKQEGHILGTKGYRNRIRQGKTTSAFYGKRSADEWTQRAWNQGTATADPNIKILDAGVAVGMGPNGGAQRQVRVVRDSKGVLHGSPWGKEYW